MLELLLAADGAVVPPRSCWSGRGTRTSTRSRHTVRMTISRLRRKLGDPPVIETVRPSATGSVSRRDGAALARLAARPARRPRTRRPPCGGG